MKTCLTPRLVVRDAAAAISFYCETLGARELERLQDPTLGGIIVHSVIEFVDGARISVIDEHREWGNLAPRSLDASPMLLMMEVEDPDAVANRMVKAGASAVLPIADRFYGYREGRVRDPFGHMWILCKVIERLDAEEIQRRLDAQ